jgi:hypothetical protein
MKSSESKGMEIDFIANAQACALPMFAPFSVRHPL